MVQSDSSWADPTQWWDPPGESLCVSPNSLRFPSVVILLSRFPPFPSVEKDANSPFLMTVAKVN